MCIQILHANRKGAMTVSQAMVPNYDTNEANVVQKYTRSINQKPLMLVCYNCGGRNHRAQDCPSPVDPRPFPRKQEESRVITPKPFQHRVSYDTVQMATPSGSHHKPVYTPQYSGGKRKSLDNYRRPSSLTSKQYEALKKQRQTASAAYAAIEASIDDILNTYDSPAEEDVDNSTSLIDPSLSVDESVDNHLDLSFE
jgi:hypothetical protein